MDIIKPLVYRTSAQNEALRTRAKTYKLPINIYEDFSTYAEYFLPKIKVGRKFYSWQWFHYYIANIFQQAIFGNGTLATIEVGPQIGKSLLTSLAITYIHGISPDTNIIYTTYNEEKATDFTKRFLLQWMGLDKYKTIFPHISLKYELDKKDSSKAGAIQRKLSTMKDNAYTLSNFNTKLNYRGGYRCFGLDQGIHGLPADIFIIDDYVSNGDQVKSEVFRKARQEWFYNDMPSRLQDNGSIIIALCTRWYNEDIIGLLHRSYDEDIVPDCISAGIEPPQLNKVRIRAAFRPTDNNPVCDPRKNEGDVLWNVHTLKYSLAKKGIYYSAMYNCDPTETDATLQLRDSDFAYYDKLPDAAGRYMFCIDGASTIKQNSDFTAIGLWFVSGFQRFLIKLWYLKLMTPDLVDFVINLLTIEYKNYDECLIEFADSGKALCQFLQQKNIRHTPLGFSGKALNDTTYKSKTDITSQSNSKMERYLRILPEFFTDEKRIFIPKEDIEHKQEFLRQMITFDANPKRKDDLVDMATYLIYYTGKNVFIAAPRNKINYKPLYNNAMCYNMSYSKNYGFNRNSL